MIEFVKKDGAVYLFKRDADGLFVGVHSDDAPHGEGAQMLAAKYLAAHDSLPEWQRDKRLVVGGNFRGRQIHFVDRAKRIIRTKGGTEYQFNEDGSLAE